MSEIEAVVEVNEEQIRKEELKRIVKQIAKELQLSEKQVRTTVETLPWRWTKKRMRMNIISIHYLFLRSLAERGLVQL